LGMGGQIVTCTGDFLTSRRSWEQPSGNNFYWRFLYNCNQLKSKLCLYSLIVGHSVRLVIKFFITLLPKSELYYCGLLLCAMLTESTSSLQNLVCFRRK